MNKPIRYEFDATGISIDNFVAAEQRTIPTNRRHRIVDPLNGPFYTESMRIRDNVSGEYLVMDKDWKPADYHVWAMQYTGKEIASTAVITNPKVSRDITLSYQVVGGHFSTNASVIKEQIEALQLDKRPVHFNNIVNKPLVYPPGKHMHAIGDVYGFEFITNALERIRDAILMGDWQQWAAIYKYIDDEIAKINQGNVDLSELHNHIKNFNNPHNVTIEQVGGYSSTKIDELLAALKNTIGGDINNLLAKLKELEDLLLAHLRDFNNPHKVTIKQLGGMTATEIRELLGNYYDKATIDRLLANLPRGTTVDLSPLWKAINDHIANKNNPHSVTAQQLNVYTKTETYNRTEIDGKIVDLRDPKTRKVANAYIPISKTKDNIVQLFDDGLYVGDQTDKKYAVSHVDAITGNDNDDDPLAGTAEKPYKTISFALSVGMANSKREIRLKEGQTHYISLPDGGSFGAKTACEVRGGTIDILPYGPQTTAISDPPGQSKFKRQAVRNLNTKILFRGTEIWGSNRDQLRMNSLTVARKATLRLWGLTLVNQIPEMCYTFSPTQYRMTTYLARVDYNSDGFIELHNCSIDTGGKNVDQNIPGINTRKVKDYTMFLTTSDTPNLVLSFEGSILDNNGWDRKLKITGNNNCFDFYNKYTAKLVVDSPTDVDVRNTFINYIRKRTGSTTPDAYMGEYYNVTTNILPSNEEIETSIVRYLTRVSGYEARIANLERRLG